MLGESALILLMYCIEAAEVGSKVHFYPSGARLGRAATWLLVENGTNVQVLALGMHIHDEFGTERPMTLHASHFYFYISHISDSHVVSSWPTLYSIQLGSTMPKRVNIQVKSQSKNGSAVSHDFEI